MTDDIVTILHDIRPEFDFSKEEDFFAGGYLDSYDMIMLITALDAKFGISINGMDIIPENFSSITSITSLLEKYGVH